MALQFQLDNLEGLDESISKLYVEKDGKFTLDVTGHEKTDDKNSIPKTRLDQEISKRKEAEKDLTEIADELRNDVPEEMKDMIPDLPPSKLIKWLRNASAKGLFNPKTENNGPDATRPGGKPTTDFKNMTPHTMMASGYKTTK